MKGAATGIPVVDYLLDAIVVVSERVTYILDVVLEVVEGLVREGVGNCTNVADTVVTPPEADAALEGKGWVVSDFDVIGDGRGGGGGGGASVVFSR